jgi:hypothetical protein
MSTIQIKGTMTQSGGGFYIAFTTSPPVISNISSGTPGQTQAIITFDTDSPCTAQVIWGTVLGGPYPNTETATTNPTLATSFSITISGLSASTTYYYKVQVTNNYSQTTTSSEQNFTTAANPPASGPPTYTGGSRSLATVVETNWSNTNPSNNTQFTDTTYNTDLLQIADNTGWRSGTNFQPAAAESMQCNLWDKDDAYFALPLRNDTTGTISWVLYDFNTTTFQASIHAGTGMGFALPSTGTPGFEIRGSGRFSENAPFASPDESGVYYGYDFTTPRLIRKLTVDPTSGGTFTTVLDPNVSTCMNGQGLQGFSGDLMVAGSGANRRYFKLFNFSGDIATGQNDRTTVLVYDATLGCRWWRTDQGTVTNATGSQWEVQAYPTGTIPSAIRGKAHNMRVGTNSKYISISWATCSGITSCNNSVWDVETLNVYTVDNASQKGGDGHGAPVGTYTMNHHNVTNAQFEIYSRPVTDPATFTQRITTGSPLFFATESYFGSFNVVNDTDYFSAVVYRNATSGSSPGALVGKLFMVKTSGSPVDWSIQANLCHADLASFSYSAPRAYVSRSGKYAYWPTKGDLCGTVTAHRRGIVAKLR